MKNLFTILTSVLSLLAFVHQGKGQTLRQLKFTSFVVNNTYSSSANGGTITIPFTAANKKVTHLRAMVQYDEDATLPASNYTINIQVSGKTGGTFSMFGAVINSGELVTSNTASKLADITSISRDDYPLKVKATIVQQGYSNVLATSGEFTINFQDDPNSIQNNSICLNSSLSPCTSNYNAIGTIVNNLNLFGTIPTRGGVNGQPPVNGYIYNWQISFDGNSWSDLTGGNTQNYTLASTTADVTYLRRVITTATSILPSYSNTITVYLTICSQPQEGICADQFIYNCTAGSNYTTRMIQGSRYWDYGSHSAEKVIWELSNQPDGGWYDVGQSPYHKDFVRYQYPAFTKSTNTTDIFYLRRRVEVKDCYLNICGKWYNILTSNVIRVVLSSCPDPATITHTLTGPSTAKCTDTDLRYDLAIDFECGISNIQWFAPAGWTFIGPSTGVKTVALNPFNGSKVNSGAVRVRITYQDGKVFEKSINVTGQDAPVVTVTPHNWPLTICGGQTTPFTITASQGLAPYSCQWVGTNLNFSTTANGDVFTALINPAQAGGAHSIKGIVTDANGCKVESYSVDVLDGTNYWTTGTPFGTWTNLPAADINWIEGPNVETVDAHIEAEQRGNIYYVARVAQGDYRLATYQWDNTASQWRNFTFPKAGAPAVSSGSLGIRELTPGDRTIFYVGVDRKLRSISSINGYQNEFTVTNNWSTETVYANTNDVQYIMLVDKNYVIYKNYSGQVYAMKNTLDVILVDGGVVEGNHAAISGTNIFYVKAGKIFCKSITTIYQTAIVPRIPTVVNNALAHTNLEIYGNFLYFTGAEGLIKRVNLTPGTVYYMNNTVQLMDPGTIICNGFFSINRKTGVIYFTGKLLDQTLNQLFYDSALGWRTKQISDADQAGSVSYTTPNAFYVGFDNVIRFTFFYMNNCNPGVERVSSATVSEDHLDGYVSAAPTYGDISVVLFPNPASSEVQVSVEGSQSDDLEYVLTDLTGKELERWSTGIIQLGEKTPGIYLMSVYENGVLLKVEKLVIK